MTPTDQAVEILSSSRATEAPAGAPGRRCVAIGNFDGVHRGHRAVIAAALQRARQRSERRPRR